MKSSTATILSISVLMGCIITLLGFTYADKVEKRITSINISIIDDVDSKFLTVPRVRTHLDAYGKIIGELEKDVQLEAIHSHLTNIPSVLNVTIFSNLNGELVIELIQRRAQARVHLEQTSDYYIDELGRSMPLDPNYSARVPIIHAENSDEVRHAFSFIKNTENDEFWTSLIDQIIVHPLGELEIVPRIGARVFLGSSPDPEELRRNLLTFYRAQIKTGNLKNYSSIDLSYKNQVIAKRHAY
jgi:cell division protein FtsQ